MGEGTILPPDRQEYWKNKLSNLCARRSSCNTSEYHYGDLYILASKGIKLYRCEACGKTVCHGCTSSSEDASEACTQCEFSGKKSTVTSLEFFKNDIKTYQEEILQFTDELKKKSEENLRQSVESCERKQAELEEKISLLVRRLETGSAETIDVRCIECGYAVVFEKSRICVTCGVENGLLIKEAGEQKEKNIKIVSCEKAEISLLCGSCILDGEHGSHQTLNYYHLKTDQLSISHQNDINQRLEVTFDKDWNNVCQKMNECHRPIVELLTRDEGKFKFDCWTSFKKTQMQQNYIVQRMVENKGNMVGHMHEYTGQMKALLKETRNLMRGASDDNTQTVQDEDGPNNNNGDA